MKKTFFLFLFLSLNFFVSAQKDSIVPPSIEYEDVRILPIEKKSFFDVAWAPVGLGLISLDLMRDSSKYGIQKIIRSIVPDTFRTHWDDYLQYVPIGMMYAADLFGVESKNTVWNQTKFLAMSEIVTSAIVLTLKYTLKIQRPNNGPFSAYPSGHTSQAFVASQVFYNEFRDTHKLFALSGFIFSGATGTLRILNNRHWLPDVLAGAGIAMLVTNTIYYFEPLKNWNPWKKKDRNVDVGFVPSIRQDYYGGHLTFTF